MVGARAEIKAHAAARQQGAADPKVSAWVSANAGSGKTRVLIDRVARLLLEGTEPSRILCITYTKAAAAEMSTRLFQRLGNWSMASNEELTEELAELGVASLPGETLDKARRLFAGALETPGGLKIETIHAFCQRLIQRFPAEAKVPPNFEVIDEREAEGLLVQARAAVFHKVANDPVLAGAVGYALDTLGEHNFGEMLKDGMAKRGIFERFFAEARDNLTAIVRAQVGLGPEEDSDSVEAACHGDAACAESALLKAASALSAGGKRDAPRGSAMREYLVGANRSEHFEKYRAVFFSKEGTPRKTLADAAARDLFPEIDSVLAAESERIEFWDQKLRAARIADLSIACLQILTHIYVRYEQLKATRSALDYDDLIAKSLQLLKDSAYAWVHFKLDGGIDHVLIDEAQDTSPDQWQIVRGLTAEFFTLEAAGDSRARTIFAVGDQKQSIYSFQGADPAGFGKMRNHFETEVSASGRVWAPTELDISFRSVPEILMAVDKIFESEAMRAALTAEASFVRHVAERVGDRGLVELWSALEKPKKDDTKHKDWTAPVDVPNLAPERRLADRVAKQIRDFIDRGALVNSDDGKTLRAMSAGDVLILVRQRGAMFYEMQRALNRERLPVAGSDRMMLHDETAYHDLDALGRFCLSPSDDLALAEVLKGPFIEFSDEDLLQIAPLRKSSLWRALGETRGQQFVRAREWLEHALALARTLRPFEFFDRVLSGRVDQDTNARGRFAARLGRDATDTIGEVLNLALAYERNEPANLQGFLAFMATRADTIKRDMEKPEGRIRVMTVHGAKGLEAPIVFLVDTCSVPAAPKGKWLFGERVGSGAPVPLLRVKKDERDTVTGRLAQEEEEGQRKEYQRQLYVATTRARDRLYIAGVASQRAYTGSWHETVAASLGAMPGIQRIDRGEGEEILRLGGEPTGEMALPAIRVGESAVLRWLKRMPPVEHAPLRRTPSGLLPQEEAGLLAAPPLAASKDPFVRGLATHKLLQLLPDIAANERAQAARRLLATAAYSVLAEQKEEIIAEILSLLSDGKFVRVFGPGSRAEVPIAGVLQNTRGEPLIISGQIDRLLITDQEILIIDFKTNRPPAKAASDVPRAYVYQMAAYAELLKAALPGHKVSAALLYTAVPRLIEVDVEGIDVTQVTGL